MINLHKLGVMQLHHLVDGRLTCSTQEVKKLRIVRFTKSYNCCLKRFKKLPQEKEADFLIFYVHKITVVMKVKLGKNTQRQFTFLLGFGKSLKFLIKYVLADKTETVPCSVQP